MQHKEIYVAIDKSGTDGFKVRPPINWQNPNWKLPDGPDNWFTLAGVLTFDFSSAEKASKEIAKRRNFEDKFQILAEDPFRYFILAYNKYACPPDFARNYKTIKMSDSPADLDYTSVGKVYSLHSWLIADSLKLANIKGNVQIIGDGDIEGKRWEQYCREVGAHVQNWIGNFLPPIIDKDNSLHKIAHFISNNYWRFLSREKPEIRESFNLIYPHVIDMTLQITEQSVGKYNMTMIAMGGKKDLQDFFPKEE